MSQNKQAYFQGGGGVNEPTPKKKKYKSDPAILVQPRFKEPLYRNYDLYDTPGEHSPGPGWHAMQNYKSVADFLKARRKKLKDKYVADDSWIQDNGSLTKNHNSVKARVQLFNKIIKNSTYDNTFNSISQMRAQQDNNLIDFPLDDFVDPAIETGSGEQADHGINYIGGFLDDYLPEDDAEDKPASTLDFGRDYTDEPYSNHPLDIDKLEKKYLNTSTDDLFGLPDGVDLHDEDVMTNNINPEYGTVENGTTMYEDKWNI